MAGSEVTVEEAVSLLGWRLPLEPTEAAQVRAKAVTHDDRRSFLKALSLRERNSWLEMIVDS
jgi:hypothetical protein